MSMRLGAVPILVASSPSSARLILQTHDTTFANRVRTATSKAGVYGAASGITFSDSGSYWRYLRQLCAVDLFSTKRIEAFKHVRTKEVGKLMRGVREEAEVGKSIELRPKLHTATNNIVSTMFLGKPLCELVDERHPNMVHLVVEVLHVLGQFNISDYFPWLSPFDLQGLARLSSRAGLRMQLAFQDIIDTRRLLRQGVFHPPHDLLDILLADSNISDNDIKAMFLDMFGGGSDTSSLLTEWAIAELLANPTKMERLQKEIKEVVGEESIVQEIDIPKMPYLAAVAKETMRLHPVLPFLVPHRANQACNVGDYHVPDGTNVFVNTWAINRDIEAWPEKTFEFWPERFLDNNIDIRGVHFQYLPFGSGRRGCPGWSLGFLNFEIMLASLLHGFHWTPLQELDMSEQFGIVMTKAIPLIVKATPRLCANLY